MYQREFDQRLRATLPQAVLLYGESDYYVDYYIEQYQQRLDASSSMLRLYYDAWDYTQAKAFLSQSSLFGGANLLVVKIAKKIPKNELEALIALTQKNPDNYFLYAYEGSAKEARSLQGSFSEKKGGVWVRFFEPNLKEGVAILQKEAHKHAIEIDYYALQHLMLLLNNNLSLCLNELEKLAILGCRITGKEIDQLVYSTAPLATEQLLIELFEKKPTVATIERLFALGEDPLSLLRATQYFIQQIFLFHSYIKLNGSVDSQAILGYKLPKPIEEQKAKLAIRIKTESFLHIFTHLLQGEIHLKHASPTQKEPLLYGLFIKLQSYL